MKRHRVSIAFALSVLVFVLSSVAGAATVLSIDFSGDSPGTPPATGGPGQPDSVVVFPGSTVSVQAAANGITTKPVVITSTAFNAYASVDGVFSPVAAGMVRVEATVSLNRLMNGYILQTSRTTALGVVTRLWVDSSGNIQARPWTGGVQLVGSYEPNTPFRARMDIDMTAKTWTLTIDAELNGFADDPAVSGLGFTNHPYNVPSVAAVDASLNVGQWEEDEEFELTTIAYDDIAVQVGTFDTTPPEITVPADMTVNATSPAGAAVGFTVTATDDVDGNVPVDCTPTSGSTFPIGDTTVECTATDTAGNGATASFTVHVQGADEQLGDLANAVMGIGPGTSLADKVAAAQMALADGDEAGACEILHAFINQVEAQSGKKIETTTADALIADAARIRAVLGFSL